MCGLPDGFSVMTTNPLSDHPSFAVTKHCHLYIRYHHHHQHHRQHHRQHHHNHHIISLTISINLLFDNLSPQCHARQADHYDGHRIIMVKAPSKNFSADLTIT